MVFTKFYYKLKFSRNVGILFNVRTPINLGVENDFRNPKSSDPISNASLNHGFYTVFKQKTAVTQLLRCSLIV